MGLFGLFEKSSSKVNSSKKTKRTSNKKNKDLVWEKATEIKGKNPKIYRKDAYGNKIRKQSYGANGTYSWEVDHKKPISKGGSNEPRNLQALHKTENRKKSDIYPYKTKKRVKTSVDNVIGKLKK